MNFREHVFIFEKLNFIDLYRKTSHAVCFFLILPQFFKLPNTYLFVCFCLFGLVCFFPHVFAPWWPRKSLLKDPVSHSREGQHVAKWVCHYETYSFKTSMKARWKLSKIKTRLWFLRAEKQDPSPDYQRDMWQLLFCCSYMFSIHLEELGKGILWGISCREATIVRAGGTPPTKHLLLVSLFVNLIDTLYYHEFFTKGASTYPGDTAPSSQMTFLLISTLHMHTWTQ